MVSWQMRLAALYVRLIRRRTFTTHEAGAALLGEPKTSSRPHRSVTRRCVVTSTDVAGFEVQTLRAVSPTSPAPLGSVVLLHGGAYVREIAQQHWQLAAQIATEVGCDVHVPIYGLAPQHTGLEALEFTNEVLARVCADGRPTHLVGDSAGGGLALLAAQAAIGSEALRIAGVTLIAPWVDLTMSNPEIDAVERIDPWLARPGLRPIAAAWAAGLDLADPRLSPIHGRMDGLPPIDLWVGTRDITLPDCRLLRDRLPASSLAGYHEQAGAIHDTPLLPVPEGRQARRAIVENIRRSLARAR